MALAPVFGPLSANDPALDGLSKLEALSSIRNRIRPLIKELAPPRPIAQPPHDALCHEFVRIYRVWNHIAQVRRSGQCHNFDDALPHCRKGSVTVRCPARPEVHFNIDLETLELAAEDEA